MTFSVSRDGVKINIVARMGAQGYTLDQIAKLRRLAAVDKTTVGVVRHKASNYKGIQTNFAKVTIGADGNVNTGDDADMVCELLPGAQAMTAVDAISPQVPLRRPLSADRSAPFSAASTPLSRFSPPNTGSFASSPMAAEPGSGSRPASALSRGDRSPTRINARQLPPRP